MKHFEDLKIGDTIYVGFLLKTVTKISRRDDFGDVLIYVSKLDKKQNPESFIVDYTKFISDPTKLIEAKELETKRIDYDKD